MHVRKVRKICIKNYFEHYKCLNLVNITFKNSESTSDIMKSIPTTNDLLANVLITTVDDATTSSTKSTTDLITTELTTGDLSQLFYLQQFMMLLQLLQNLQVI